MTFLRWEHGILFLTLVLAVADGKSVKSKKEGPSPEGDAETVADSVLKDLKAVAVENAEIRMDSLTGAVSLIIPGKNGRKGRQFYPHDFHPHHRRPSSGERMNGTMMMKDNDDPINRDSEDYRDREHMPRGPDGGTRHGWGSGGWGGGGWGGGAGGGAGGWGGGGNWGARGGINCYYCNIYVGGGRWGGVGGGRPGVGGGGVSGGGGGGGGGWGGGGAGGWGWEEETENCPSGTECKKNIKV